ncbi:MAG: YHS domain-containing (seleno)protein [Cyanobacteria bacterium P01_F01_bin.150]
MIVKKMWVGMAIASTLLLGTVACSDKSTSSAENATTSTQVSDAGAPNADTVTPDAEVALQVNVEEGVAIDGADPVAYFTESKALIGDAAFAHEWQGATWHFASAENRDLFAENPEQYAPQYLGYCAWAVSQGYTAPIDPEAWKIVDGKLYLNYDKRVQDRWSKDIPGNIAKADANWPGVLAN